MHSRFIASAILLLALCTSAPLSAQVAASPLSLTEALAIADRDSSLLAAQRSSITAAEENTFSARELPDPTLKFGVDSLPVTSSPGVQAYSRSQDSFTMLRVSVGQQFIRDEKRELKGRKAEHRLAREQSTLASAQAGVRRDVALPWMERYFAERMAAIVDEQYAEAELQLQTLKAGLRSNKSQPAELLMLQVYLQSLLDRRAEFEKQSARARALLARWLPGDSTRPLAGLPARLNLGQRHEISDHAVRHPHLQSLENQIDIANSEAALATAARKPDWGLEVVYGRREPQFSNLLSVFVSIDLPIFQTNRQDRGIAAKFAEVERARALKEDALRQHVAEANAAWSDWEAATSRIKRFDDTLLPLTRERTQLALAAYRGGQGPLTAVLEARRIEIDLRLQQLQLAAEQGRAYAQLLYFLPKENQQ